MKKRFLLVAFLTVTIALSFSSFYVQASPDTFGKTDKGETQLGDAGRAYTFGKYTVAGTITITHIDYYAAASGNVRVAVYEGNAEDNKAGALIVESGSVAVLADQFNHIDVADTQSSAGYYVLAWQQDAWDVDCFYDADATKDAYYKAHDYGAFPNPYGVEDVRTGSAEFSMYATYTTAGQEYERSASQSIGVASSAARLFETTRSVTQAINIGLETSRIPDFARGATQAIGVGLSADRLIEVTRQVAQTLGISIVGDRLIEVSRAVTQAINVALDGFGSKVTEYNRAANITLTFVHGVMGLFFDDYATKGFVLAAIFLLIFIGAPITALIWRKR